MLCLRHNIPQKLTKHLHVLWVSFCADMFIIAVNMNNIDEKLLLYCRCLETWNLSTRSQVISNRGSPRPLPCPWPLSLAPENGKRLSRLLASPRGKQARQGGRGDAMSVAWLGSGPSPHKGIPPVLTILLCSLKLHDIWVMLLIWNIHYNPFYLFHVANLPKGKSLGRSKPATNSSNEQAH